MLPFSSNLFDPDAMSLLSNAPQPLPAIQAIPAIPSFHEFHDTNKVRSLIYDKVLYATQHVQPISNDRHTLRLSGVAYRDGDKFSKQEQKAAILHGRTQGRRLEGTWELLDNATQQVIDSKKSVLATVPHLTDRGTFINNGTEYILRNQQRLLPGVYTRTRNNGEVESHVNIMAGKGVSHRYFLDPEKGRFKLRVGQASVGLTSLLKAMGVTAEQAKEAWGTDLFAANYNADDATDYTRLKGMFLSAKELQGPEDQQRQGLLAKFAKMEMDPEVTRRTLGKPYANMSLDAVLDITKKLINVNKKEADPDDRDALHFQRFVGPEDLFSERIERDKGQVRRNLLWKMSGKGNLSSMPSSVLDKQLKSALLSSGLGQAIEEINPTDLYEKTMSVTRVGEGGISSMDAIPKESRNVQSSMLGYIDPVRTPESGRVGVDTYLARGARKGSDGKLYAQFRDLRTGEMVYKTPQDVANLTVGFPGSLEGQDKRVPAMRDGKMLHVLKESIDLELPNMEESFNPLSNIIPMKSQVKGQRLVMASRMTTQALPLVSPEAPLVQSAVPDTDGQQSYEELYAAGMGALRAAQAGKVIAVTAEEIIVRNADGTEETHELYNNFPFNRKTFFQQTAVVKPGDTIKPNQLLASSNYTDKAGTMALGVNARTAYIPWQGKNFEDAIVISESFAKRTASSHMYQHELELDDKTQIGKRQFIQAFPATFKKETLATIDDQGMVKPGTIVNFGDPLVLGITQKENAYNKVHRQGQKGFNNAAVLWEHQDSGVVTDVVMGRKGPVVVVKAESPTQIGDKLSGRYGDKGVIADIIPDGEMPQGAAGQPFEVLLNPLGIISRTNPAQMSELFLGKIAAKRGTPIKVADFDTTKDMSRWVLQELVKEGLSDLEDIVDPSKDQKISNVATGSRFFIKLHHTAESKGQGRSGGAYTTEDAPAKGGTEGSKRIGLMDANALLSHGATDTLQDIFTIRRQKNDQYWMQFMAGYDPKITKVPFAYQKFVSQLQSAGVNVVKQGTQTQIMAMTDKDIDSLAGDRELTSAEGVEWGNQLKEISGGLFDKAKTGGHGGTRWSFIKLHEPLPNPVMEEPIRCMLGLTKKKFEGVIAGTESLDKYGSGTAALQKALENFNVDAEISKARAVISAGRGSQRDEAIRKLSYAKAVQKLGLQPKDYMLTKVPVLPPMFRPVSLMSNGMPLVNDANHLYKELFETNQNFKKMQQEVGNEASGTERLSAYQAFKAVTGLGDAISAKSQEKNVRGALKNVFGESPKFGVVQRKLISSTVDNVGRAVITPNPSLDMDSVGLPEDKAFKVYEKFVTRRLVRQGMSMLQARVQLEEKTPVARNLLIEEMEHRPVYISRAPVLHKFGIMAMKPRLTKGNTLQISPLIVKGFGADFDGDTMNYHVPSTEKARKEALDRLLPSRNLFSIADMKSVMHAPANEYIGGLFMGTDPSRKSTRPVRIFQNIRDAKRAYESGSISVNDQVRILNG